MLTKADVDNSASAFALAILQAEAEAGRHKDKLQLQKLLYLTDAASAALWNRPAFHEPVIALPHGPALAKVTDEYKQIADPTSHIIEQVPDGDPGLGAEDRATVAWVLARFGEWSASRLINYTKRDENPWAQVYEKYGAGPQSVIAIEHTVAWFSRVGLDPASSVDNAAALEAGAGKIATAHAVALEKLGR